MQINAYSPSSVTTVPQGPAGNSSDPATAQTAKTKGRALSPVGTATDSQVAAATTNDTVSIRKLSAADIANLDKQAANDNNSGSNLVYAEIWKDGMKVGQVYSDGRVTGEGVTIDMGGTDVLSAQTRAQQLASQLGGEVRYPGQPDAKAEKMRAQLRAAYGV